MRKLAVVALVISAAAACLVAKINYEQGKSSDNQEQINNQNMCEIVHCNK